MALPAVEVRNSCVPAPNRGRSIDQIIAQNCNRGYVGTTQARLQDSPDTIRPERTGQARRARLQIGVNDKPIDRACGRQ